MGPFAYVAKFVAAAAKGNIAARTMHREEEPLLSTSAKEGPARSRRALSLTGLAAVLFFNVSSITTPSALPHRAPPTVRC